MKHVPSGIVVLGCLLNLLALYYFRSIGVGTSANTPGNWNTAIGVFALGQLVCTVGYIIACRTVYTVVQPTLSPENMTIEQIMTLGERRIRLDLAKKITSASLVIFCMVAAGCMQPAPVPGPSPISTGLSGSIQSYIQAENMSVSKLAQALANNVDTADTQTMKDNWNSGYATIVDKFATDMQSLLKEQLDIAGNNKSALKSMWQEVAKGYGP